ncbi:MAG: hypothetical protein CMJ46_14985 [Planctomyces sp.]|nr:hypothetical protein [Planctomyces sp.]
MTHKSFIVRSLAACGMMLCLGLTVSADEYLLNLDSNLEDLTDEFSISSSFDGQPVQQTTWLDGGIGKVSLGDCCSDGCGMTDCCEPTCCAPESCAPTCYAPTICEPTCCAPTCCGTDSCGIGCCGNGGCHGGCGEGCGCGCGQTYLGCLKSTPCGWSDFISPMTNPVFFEDPRTLTEARFIFLDHRTPRSLGADSIRLLAVQLRAALTDRLSIIATKDGFIMSDSPLVDDGWADVSAGLKYNLYADVCKQQILSVGATYELPVGTPRALQGNGDGEFNIFLSGGAEIVENVHWISATGFRLPADTTSESQSWYWSNHLDYEVIDNIYLFGETNWYHWMKSGDGGVPGIEGGDIFNLGSTGVAGNDIVTGAIGIKVKPAENQEIGFAYEVPLTDRRDVLDERYTIDWIIRF